MWISTCKKKNDLYFNPSQKLIQNGSQTHIKSDSHSVVSNSLWPMDSSLPVSSVHGILQASILEWVAISTSRGSSQPRYWIASLVLKGEFFITVPPGSLVWSTETLKKGKHFLKSPFTLFQSKYRVYFYLQ